MASKSVQNTDMEGVKKPNNLWMSLMNLPECGVGLLGHPPSAVAVRVQVVHHLPHVGVHVPAEQGKISHAIKELSHNADVIYDMDGLSLEQAGCLLPGAPESPDDPAQVGEGDGDAHQQREGRHQVNLVHRGRVVVVEVEPEMV